MKKFLYSICGVLLAAALPWKAQAQSAIYFDGSNDYVEVLNASNHIANGSISMAFWIYPTNASPAYPNFDGFAGFRNNSTADFYILQLSSTNVECRFRNNNGVNYDINASAVNLNQWNHYVLTYDQSALKFYHNGSLVQSVSASGTIASGVTPLHLGKLDWSPSPFYSTAKMDEFGLWSRALTATEVAALYSACSIPNSSTDLKLHYGFNEGVAGGNNTGVTTAVDLKGNTNGTYHNFAMAGTTSNFVSKPGDVFVNDTAEACGSYTTAGGNTYTASGVYADTSASTSGCLEVHTLYLTILSADTSVTRTGNDFMANDSTATSYTWIDCSTGSSVGTNQTFSATANGSYACIVAGTNGCTDTSACFTVSGIGLTEFGGKEWAIYPNPGLNQSLQLHGPIRSGLKVTLYNVLGMPLQRWENEAVLVEGLAPGVYIFVLEEAGVHVSLRALVN
jgi:hypothetical protein